MLQDNNSAETAFREYENRPDSERLFVWFREEVEFSGDEAVLSLDIQRCTVGSNPDLAIWFYVASTLRRMRKSTSPIY